MIKTHNTVDPGEENIIDQLISCNPVDRSVMDIQLRLINKKDWKMAVSTNTLQQIHSS